MRIRVERRQPGRQRTDMTRVAVILPAYNEAARISEAVQRARTAGAGHIICVDDGSSDDTPRIIDELADRECVEALHHTDNRGKQAAVKTGLTSLADRDDIEVVAVLDADMQDDPAHLPGLAPLVGEYDMVNGYRSRENMPPVRRLSNALANVPHRLAGVDIRDVQAGYRVYTRETAVALGRRLPDSGGYTIEHGSLPLFARLAREWGRDFRIAEVPIPYSYAGAESYIGFSENCNLVRAALRYSAELALLQG